MVNKMDKYSTPIRPYDDSMWDHWTMYDNMPYVWDPDLNTEKKFVLVSGNVIKGYRVQMKDEPYELKYE